MRVTAIVSAYYAEQYLDGRIQNLLDQSEKPEIVVICKDPSPELDIARKYDVRIIVTPDVPGIYEAWNMGIRAASGKYLTSANSDDRFYPGALKQMADILDKESTYGVVYADVDIVEDIDAEPVRTFNWMEGGLPELLKGCFIGPMPLWRKSLHDRFGYFDESLKVAGDYEYWLRLAKSGVKFYHIRGNALGRYLKRENSAEHRESLRSLWEANQVRSRYREAVCTST